MNVKIKSGIISPSVKISFLQCLSLILCLILGGELLAGTARAAGAVAPALTLNPVEQAGPRSDQQQFQLNIRYARRMIHIDPAIVSSAAEREMVVSTGPGRFDNCLAMDLDYSQIPRIRDEIADQIGRPLDFFRGWDADGEAHITVITPPEYYDFLAGPDKQNPIISMEEIGEIARRQQMQSAGVWLLGIGSGRAKIDGRTEETFFLIVESDDLRNLRAEIHREFVKRGGEADSWNPDNFYPHITIGYTLRDLHESDGILKNLRHSFDRRFRLRPGGSDSHNYRPFFEDKPTVRF